MITILLSQVYKSWGGGGISVQLRQPRSCSLCMVQCTSGMEMSVGCLPEATKFITGRMDLNGFTSEIACCLDEVYAQNWFIYQSNICLTECKYMIWNMNHCIDVIQYIV